LLSSNRNYSSSGFVGDSGIDIYGSSNNGFGSSSSSSDIYGISSNNGDGGGPGCGGG
jgi:hypothetical protein